MNKLILPLILAFAGSLAFGQGNAVVTATVQIPSGAPASATSVRVDLINCQYPQIPGTAFIVPKTQTFVPNSNGLVTMPMWSSNAIYCGAQGASSYYAFNFIYNGSVTSIGSYLIPPGNNDLSSLPPYGGGGGGGGVVTSINGKQGAFTFNGPGVTCVNTVCTFTGGSGAPTPAPFFSFSFTNVASFVIPASAHGYGNSNLIVKCYDVSGNELTGFPAHINQSNYEVDISFALPQSGKIVIAGGGNGAGAYLPSVGGTGNGAYSLQGVNGTLNEQLYTGPTVAARVNAAEAACTSVYTATCIIQIPAGEVAGNGWNTTSNNIIILDQRGASSNGSAFNGFPNFHSSAQYEYYAGANDPYENGSPGAAGNGKMVFSINADAIGGSNGALANTGNMVALFVRAQRETTSTRSIWSINSSTSCNNYATAGCTGYELDIGNNSGTVDTQSLFNGLHVVGNGIPGSIGAGVAINGITSQYPYMYGIKVASYHNQGISLSTTDTSRIADIFVTPPADDTSTVYRQTNSNGGTITAQIDSLGNSQFTSVRIGSSIGPLISGGTGSPTTTCPGTGVPLGSMYLSTTNSGTGHNLFICETAGWQPK